MSDLFNNFARSAKDFDGVNPGETLIVGMPGSILAGHVMLYTDIDFAEGKVTLRDISQVTNEKFSGMVKQFTGKKLTRKEDERYIIKAGPFAENDGYILTMADWGEKYNPYECGYFNLFANMQALEIIAEGFGPDEFLVMRGSVEIPIQELKDLLDKNIVVAIDADPDIVFDRDGYEQAVEAAAHLSIIESLHKGPRP